MKIEIIDTKYGAIEYSIYGKGEAVLFIHGGHSNAHETLSHKHISAERYSLITASRPGYGNTPLLDNNTALKSAKLILELMNYLKIDKFNVIGISAGGLTAISLVSLYPDRIIKFVMASSISKRWLKPDDKLYKKAKRIFNPRLEKYVWGLLKFGFNTTPKLLIKQISTELTSVKIKDIDDEEIRDFKTMFLNQRSKHGFMADLEHEIEEGLIDRIITSTLIIHSKNDKSIDLEHPKYAKQKIKNSKIIWVDNKWGHLIWVAKESKEIIANINSFLEA